jgi:preprotein translocase subunit YajC
MMPNSRARAAVRRLAVFALVAAVALLSAGCLTESTTSTTAADGTTGTTAAPTSTGSAILTIVMYAVVIGGLFYFLVRPQRTRQKRAQELQSSLGVGDEVQTIGGIYGTIEYFDEETGTAVLQIEGGGKIRVARRALADKVKPKGR